jgi:AhpD family alkylhydroperoxidase
MELQDELENIMKKGIEIAAEDMLKSLEEAYGEVPYIYQFLKDHPELMVTKMLYNNAVLRSSKSLDMKTVEIIAIAVSAAIRCNHCLEMHIRVARRMGITDDQIAAAMFIAGNMVNASILATATRRLDEERDVCRACEMGNGVCEIHSGKESEG